ncbi:MAG: CRISPR-associated helicase Cas3 [Candidatus Roizmanbacteria bacterium GW2011_GWA2_35_19]|uniref:CRISPR-associated helicase Cas3 n=2 Tax=Candidatus Roizmaniibacteriota TaxID=1752723 RepID=A0A0G0BTN9_9BACT|nr:MAG: CRISPR-associated helicase Cas3 [Candidatus Roizmanbacteria bacterium GW2011_GWC2_35_12]KKP72824.1 MAG: CRISPR-associated helicase Cas3 [Candidatus Roizmanbacteria bacterium GW2011_GWA2_35_19]
MVIKTGATSYKQTKYGILPRQKVLELEVLGTKKGLLFLNQKAKTNKITPGFIKQIHKASFSEILVDDAGKFRIIQVTYSGKEAPHFSKIAEMIKVLCDDIEFTISKLPKSTDDQFIERVIELLARFQHRFVFIHPFVDYNGRTSRMFTSYILMRLNLPIIEIKTEKNKERKEYIQSLQKADTGEYQKLETIISTALNESMVKAIKK